MLHTALRLQVIRDELRNGKSEKQVEQKLTDDYGEGILYAPKFDMQSSLLYLMPVCEAVGNWGARGLGGMGQASRVNDSQVTRIATRENEPKGNSEVDHGFHGGQIICWKKLGG